MANIVKFSGYLVDPNGDYDKNHLEHVLDRYTDFIMHHLHIEEADMGEWDDECPLNYENPDLAECEKWFRTAPSEMNYDRDLPKQGDIWKHFKTGKHIGVLEISQDTENPGSFSVVYACLDRDNHAKIWHRPLDMFMSEVDHKKYPDAQQKYRFEKVEV